MIPLHFSKIILKAVLPVFLLGSYLHAQEGKTALPEENENCLGCHDDRALTGTKNGKTIPVHVRRQDFLLSVHPRLECTACHQALNGSEFPHAEEVPAADCSICHNREADEYQKSIHGKAQARGDRMAPGCGDCHGTHRILPRSHPDSPIASMNIPLTCGKCHHEGSAVSLTHQLPQDRILENYSESIHGAGLFQKGLTVTAVCTSCHQSHLILPGTDSQSSVHRRNIARTCTRCHARIESVHRKVIEGKLWETEPHKIPACSDCHSTHKIRKSTSPQGMASQDCLTCHRRPDLSMTRNGRRISLAVDEMAFAASAHGQVACAQCHNEVKASRTRPCETITGKVDCSICHAEIVRIYQNSRHGDLASRGDPDAPGCLDCHDYHLTKKKQLPSSPTYPRNVPELCARCHRAGQKAAVRIKSGTPDIVQSYQTSIHGTGLFQSGLVVTATCADCHSPHGELPPDDPRSTVHPANLSKTCGTCHKGIEEIYRSSIHGRGVKTADGRDLPTCENCHSSHSIRRIDKPGFRFEMMRQCGNCHRTEADTFFATYHGKVTQLGSAGAAKCYDCHGTHDIFPVTDSKSRLSRAHVVQTCAKCHPGAHRRFAGYLTHATHHDRDKYPWLFFAFWGMTTLLVGTLTFSLLHTLAWLWRLWRSKESWSHHKKAAVPDRFHLRFTSFQRGMHLAMLISFFTLAITGMALKFSYMSWAQFLSRLMGGFDAMGGLHRMGAVVLFIVFFIHLWDVFRKKKESGLSWFRYLTGPGSMLFNRRDFREIAGSIKWFFGRGERPAYGRFTYWEKFDYFAVFWGVFIIGSTGLFLWFPEFFTYLLPGAAINVATIIHSDEALLAVAFIFTIHFFNTHFRPDKFPMDPVIFTGRVPVDELKYDKPDEYAALLAGDQLDSTLVPPMPARLEKYFRIFGFIALAIGLILIGLIVFSMLYGYQ